MTLAGLAIRLHRLDRESFWTDEAFSVSLSQRPLGAILRLTAGDVHPPLYYFALHVWMGVAGTSPAAVRMLSAVFSALAIPLVFRLASRVFDRTTGIVAAVFLAGAVFHVASGQEARMYSLLALLSLASMDYTCQLARGGGRSAVVGYAVSSALMLYTHVYGVFLLAGESASFALLFLLDRDAWRCAWKRCVLAQALALVLYLPWMLVLLRQVAGVEHDYWIPRLGLIGVWSAISQFAGSWGLSKLLRLLAVVAVVAGLARWPRDSRLRRWEVSALALWMAGPLLLPWLISEVSTPIFLVRCTIAASLAFYLLAARGVMLLPGRLLKIAGVGVVIVLNAIAVRGYFSVMVKDQWREAAAAIGAAARPGDLLLFDRAYGQMPFDYYLRRHDLAEVPCLDDAEEQSSPEIAARVDAAARGHDRVWLIVSNADRVVPIAIARLGQVYALQSRREWRGVAAYLFVRQVSAGSASSVP